MVTRTTPIRTTTTMRGRYATEHDTLDVSFENVYRQYLACRRNKRNTINALAFEAKQEKELVALSLALQRQKIQ